MTPAPAFLLGDSVSRSLRWHALPPLWVVVLVIVPLVLLGVRFLYRTEAGRVGRKLRITMGLLRAAAVFLVLFALFGPYAETIEGIHFKRHLILAVDTSGSMGFKDPYRSDGELAEEIRQAAGYGSVEELAARSRLELVRDVLGRDRAYLERLASQFRLHLYAFADSTANLVEPREGETGATTAERIVRALPGLEAKGAVTRIGQAIQDLVRDFDARNEPVAGLLLFTDGRHTGGDPQPEEEAGRAATGTREGIPIFPVWTGDPGVATNVAVSRVDAPEVALAGDEVYFTATVHARGLEGKAAQLVAEILDAEGNVESQLAIDTEPFSLPADGASAKVSFRHIFLEPGRYNLRIGVPPLADEAVQDDNWQRHVLNVVKLEIRVLLVANLPSRSYRFLKEALFKAEETIDASVLLLSAEPEWPQEASRGTEPIQEWPREKKDLAAYDVILLLDVDLRDRRILAGRAPEEIFEMLESWVKRGGGLVLEAGRDGNIPREWDEPTLQALLPVVPYRGMRRDRLDELAATQEKKKYRLTPTGAAHPIVRILQDSEAVREFWESEDYATEYYWYAPVERAKSSAAVLALRMDASQATPTDQPVLALQDYGSGKVLWVGTDEIWRMRKYVENRYYWRFWSGVIRHLATYRLLSGNRRIKVWVDRADAHYQVGEPVIVEAKFLDENFEPVAPSDADPGSKTRSLKLRAPDGSEAEVALQAVVEDPPQGVFRTRLSAGKKGTYSLVAGSGDDVAETTFVVEDTTLEMSNPLLDMPTLRRIAERSKGEVLSLSDFAKLLENPKVPSAGIVRSGDPHRTDLWDRSWVLWLAVGLLAVEWILRRRNLLL